jgi:hypothetical protein
MAELIACPNCRRQLQVPAHYLGETVQCPECQHRFTATASSVSTKPTAPAPVETGRTRTRERYDDDDDDDDDLDDIRIRRLRHRRSDWEPHRGAMILTLGLVALVGGMSFCGLPLVIGPIAWLLGAWDLRAMRDGQMDPDGESMTRTGQVCGIIATVLLVIGTPIVCFAFMG